MTQEAIGMVGSLVATAQAWHRRHRRHGRAFLLLASLQWGCHTGAPGLAPPRPCRVSRHRQPPPARLRRVPQACGCRNVRRSGRRWTVTRSGPLPGRWPRRGPRRAAPKTRPWPTWRSRRKATGAGGRDLFPAGTRRRPPPGGQIPGAARGHEPQPPVAAAGQAGRGPRPPGTDLWPVHGGL